MILVVGNQYKCQAIEIRDYGAIMKMEDGTTQLLHISNISTQFVRSVCDYITVGNFYIVTAVKGKVKDVEIMLVKEAASPEPVTDEDDFVAMLENYLPTYSDKRYKHDSYYDTKYKTKKRKHK